MLACLVLGCSGDTFDYPDAADPSPFPAPPRLALRLTGDDAATPDASQEAAPPDAGCTMAIDPLPYCKGACATTDGGITCGNTSNNVCASGFFGECFAPSGCGTGKICALVPVGIYDANACPPSIASQGQGVTATCADPSYLDTFKGARVLCSTAGDCAVLDGGGSHACVGAAIAGYPALAGEAVGICE
jgi:hypothetical protein